MEQGGTKANKTGSKLELYIENHLKDNRYTFTSSRNFKTALYLQQPIYAKQMYLCKGIYETRIYGDFVIFHPEKHPNCLIIESKWQQTGGTADEKLPYTIMNIKEKYPYPTILVIDGGGYRKGALDWVRKQIGGKLNDVFNMSDFQKWANQGYL